MTLVAIFDKISFILRKEEAMSERPNTLTVVRAIIRNGCKFLLLKRSSQDRHAPGAWELPGGKVDPGDLIQSALPREVEEEEAGIKIKTHTWMTYYNEILGPDSRYPNFLYIVLYIECWMLDHNDNVKISNEHEEFCWVSLKEARVLENISQPCLEALELYCK